MTQAEAIEVAAAFASDAGYDVNQYAPSAEKKDDRWEIDFRRTGDDVKPRPGDFFTVFVDDNAESVLDLVEGK